MTVEEHKHWQGLKGRKVSLSYDNDSTDNGKEQGIIKGTRRARSHPSNDAVVVQVAGRRIRVRPSQIVKVH